MIAVIRISGMVNIDGAVQETLHRLRIRRKYSLTLIQDTPENRKLLQNIRNFVAYGDISKEVLKELIEKRAELKDKSVKLDADKISKDLEKTSINKLSIKPFFRLHPPIGGIDSKKHFGVSSKAVLGDHKDKIDDLIRRML